MSDGANLILNINTISTQVIRYLSIFLLVFGTIGNVLNLIVFLQRSLRSNPCSVYFFSSSISSLVSLYSGLITRTLATYRLDPTNKSSIQCKIRSFFLFSSFTTSTWLIAVASIDRYFISCQSTQRRRLSSLKNAYYLTGIISIFSMLIYAEVFYCFEANLSTPPLPLPCYSKNYSCQLYNDLTFAIIFVLIPCLLMFIFGYLTILNVRKLNRAVGITFSTHSNNNNKDTKHIKKSDRQLIEMLLAQVLLLTTLALPTAIQRLYSTLSVNTVRSQLTLAIENFIFQLLLLLTFVSTSMPFYLYLLTGTLFRRTLIGLFYKVVLDHTVRDEISVTNIRQNTVVYNK
ncbi:unnamed protein product [Didymodactylos carnosus]|uniref:G-protein coupled receptors family 1 profile domain-containing protein n=1 Tax=Didymodactylos carnosus TaxID=1234261 RepID=A0A815DCG7_9BILA|nr:unnamed protein product [Didymodactylos carnosus]CAF1299747.1 unnamed protein product [Didymodactylos carnosus]CAF4059600.1 unnamed protein product [Didymodactylos carnosus]CAF4121444.1 unnamed protein product [Didymodactylos carnosus]